MYHQIPVPSYVVTHLNLPVGQTRTLHTSTSPAHEDSSTNPSITTTSMWVFYVGHKNELDPFIRLFLSGFM